MADKDKKDKEKKPKEEKEEAVADKADKKGKKPAAEGEEAKEGEAVPEGKAKKKFPLKLVIIIVVVLAVVISGTVTALLFTGVLGGAKPPVEGAAEAGDSHGEKAAEGEKADEGGHGGGAHGEKGAEGGDGHSKKKGGAVFYDMGEIVVNLQAEGRRQTFLKLVVQLELENEADKPMIDNIKPRIIDNFQTYLRELRLDDLRGSSGLYRLREELLFRVTEAAYPVKVKDVLFQQMLVQ